MLLLGAIKMQTNIDLSNNAFFIVCIIIEYGRFFHIDISSSCCDMRRYS